MDQEGDPLRDHRRRYLPAVLLVLTTVRLLPLLLPVRLRQEPEEATGDQGIEVQ